MINGKRFWTCLAAKPLILAFIWIPLDTNNLPKHPRKPSIYGTCLKKLTHGSPKLYSKDLPPLMVVLDTT